MIPINVSDQQPISHWMMFTNNDSGLRLEFLHNGGPVTRRQIIMAETTRPERRQWRI